MEEEVQLHLYLLEKTSMLKDTVENSIITYFTHISHCLRFREHRISETRSVAIKFVDTNLSLS